MAKAMAFVTAQPIPTLVPRLHQNAMAFGVLAVSGSSPRARFCPVSVHEQINVLNPKFIEPSKYFSA